jgi:hypothetical protein
LERLEPKLGGIDAWAFQINIVSMNEMFGLLALPNPE